MVAGIYKRHRRWFDLAVGIIVVAWLIWRLAPDGDRVADPELLIEKFDVTAFRRDDTIAAPSRIFPFVHKWAGPVRLRLHGAATNYRELAEELTTELSRLTGLQFSIVKPGAPASANFNVHVVSPNEVSKLVIDYGATPEEASPVVKNVSCMAGGWSKEGRKMKAYAIIKNNLREERIRHCFFEEITQALGLFADSDVVQPSIFSEQGPKVDELPMNDKILVRVLYDKRITPGMKREEAMAVVRELVPRLVEAVRARGVEALYQQ